MDWGARARIDNNSPPKVRIPLASVNHGLRYRRFYDRDAIVGFDGDGYSIAGRRRGQYVASIEGVIGDVLPYETGATRVSMAFQAHLEKVHVERADLVVTPSHYCAGRLDELYKVATL